MARSPVRRSKWHRNHDGTWSCSLGERGTRVRLFQKREDGVFHRAVWRPGVGRDQRSLGTRDRNDAERLGRLLLAAILRGEAAPVAGPVRLGDLWERFQRECAEFVDNKPRTREDAAMRVRYLLAYFGAERDVRQLTGLDQLQYTETRRRGGIKLESGRVSRPVRARSAEADIYVLHQMLAWACKVPTPSGGRWLERNPLAGVRREREKNPRREVATWERYEATRLAMQNLRTAAEASVAKRRAAGLGTIGSETEARRWLRMELALVLAEATGRRLNAIRELRWEDVDWDAGTIRWRAESDKKGREWVVPVPTTLLDELRHFRRELGVIAGCLFRSEHDPSVPMDRHRFDKWLTVAERKAGLPKLKGTLWHAYRRKWASERKHHPLPDVAAAGGWKDYNTLLECYQAPDATAILAVMSEPRKRHELRAAGGARSL